MARTYNNYTDIIDFSRASVATYRDADGVVRTAAIDEPRIDYDENHFLLGVLLEPQRTNLYENGVALENSTNFSCYVVQDNVISPDGEQTGDAIFETAGSAAVRLLYESGISADVTDDYCISAFVKPGHRDRVSIGFQCAEGNITGNFYISNGACYSNSAGANSTFRSSGSTSYSNGWKRIWVSGTLQTVDVGNIGLAGLILLDDDGATAYTGDDSSPAIYAWGLQLEPGRYPSSLIYTDGAQATRALDYVDIPVDAFRYSSNSGTIVLTARCSDYQQYNTRLVNLGATSNEGLDLWVRNTDTVAVYRDDVNEVLAQSTTVSRDDYHNLAFSYNTDSNVGGLAVNGATHSYSNVVSDVSSVSTIQLNREGTNNGTAGVTHIKNLSYYPRALSLDYIGELTRV